MPESDPNRNSEAAVRISDADDHYACDPADCPDAVQAERTFVDTSEHVLTGAEQDQAGAALRLMEGAGDAIRCVHGSSECCADYGDSTTRPSLSDGCDAR